MVDPFFKSEPRQIGFVWAKNFTRTLKNGVWLMVIKSRRKWKVKSNMTIKNFKPMECPICHQYYFSDDTDLEKEDSEYEGK